MTWYLTAADDRVKVAAPCCSTAHIPQHLRDWTLDTHCDCTFYPNLYQMPMEECYALSAPRPVLIAAQERDLHFLPWSYRAITRKIKPVWRSLGSASGLSLVEDGGPHSYGPKLTAAIYAWFEKHLKPSAAAASRRGEERVESQATLSCFRGKLPRDDISHKIQDRFIPAPKGKLLGPKLLGRLRKTVFSSWPKKPAPFHPERVVTFDDYSGEAVDRVRIASEEDVRIDVEIRMPRGWNRNRKTPLVLLPAEMRYLGRGRGIAEGIRGKVGLAFVETRGLGPWSYPDSATEFYQRAGMLLGEPLDVKRLWDLIRAYDFLSQAYPKTRGRRIWLGGKGPNAVLAILAALYRPSGPGVLAMDLPKDLSAGPYFPGIERHANLRALTDTLGKKRFRPLQKGLPG